MQIWPDLRSIDPDLRSDLRSAPHWAWPGHHESSSCSEDPKQSITNLKNGDNLKLNFCDSQPVAKHYAIGQKLGISGTPAIISEDGELYPGYFSPKDLLDKLKS